MSYPPLPGFSNGMAVKLTSLPGVIDPLRLDRAASLPFTRHEHKPQLALAPVTHTRRRIWDFDTHLHCSIIGTCLTTAELRRALAKLGFADAGTASEHEVHATGVRAAGRKQEGAKFLHKVLDRCHRSAISCFDKAKSTEAVRALWQDALQRGEVPGAYWAALTHPASDDALVKEVFTEVHMLSHLVGAANRADIRRLRQLEEEKAELEEKVERQQRQLRDVVVARDATIRELRQVLEVRLIERPVRDDGEAAEGAGWEAVASELKLRLCRVESRSEKLEQQLAEARAVLVAEREARTEAEQREQELSQELEAIEASLSGVDSLETRSDKPLGLTLLYVGGRQARIGHLRELAERSGAEFLHHDGGIEEREGLLPGLVSRADAVVFPVDCISHAAMSLVKRLCQQAGKPFLPLRGGGLAPFCAALKTPGLRAVEA